MAQTVTLRKPQLLLTSVAGYGLKKSKAEGARNLEETGEGGPVQRASVYAKFVLRGALSLSLSLGIQRKWKRIFGEAKKGEWKKIFLHNVLSQLIGI